MRSIFYGQEQSSGTKNAGRSSTLRGLIERRCLSPLTLNDDDSADAMVLVSLYQKLPQQQVFNLTVLKLDGTLFDVSVGRNATVADLKQAVEEVFCSSPNDGGEGNNISWSHVWSHFCLCYDGQKLIKDRDRIRNFGISDGDQLQFIKHMSTHFSLSKRPTKNRVAPKSHLMLPSGSDVDKEKEQKTTLNYNERNESQDCNFKYFNYEEQEEIPMAEFRLANFLRGWLSYSGLWGSSRKGPVSGLRRSNK